MTTEKMLQKDETPEAMLGHPDGPLSDVETDDVEEYDISDAPVEDAPDRVAD